MDLTCSALAAASPTNTHISRGFFYVDYILYRMMFFFFFFSLINRLSYIVCSRYPFYTFVMIVDFRFLCTNFLDCSPNDLVGASKALAFTASSLPLFDGLDALLHFLLFRRCLKFSLFYANVQCILHSSGRLKTTCISRLLQYAELRCVTRPNCIQTQGHHSVSSIFIHGI